MAGTTTGSAYLVKRPYGDGWRWCGQIKYKDAGGKWRTLRKALSDEDGAPILTDADQVDEDGTRTQTTRNIRKARKALDAWRAEVDGAPTGGRMQVGDYMQAELDRREGTVQASTLRKYREYAPIIARSLPPVAVRDMGAEAVKAMVSDMRDRGLSPSTIETAYNVLHGMLESAVEDGYLAANPCTRAFRRKYVRKQGKADPNALDMEATATVNAMLDGARNPRVRVGARLALACGLRCGEVCGLRWIDVDLDGLRLHVRAAIGRGDGETYAKEAKTEGSEREVPLPRSLAAELTAWRFSQLSEWAALAAGQRNVAPFTECRVVGYADGRFMTPHALSNAWSKLERSGGPDGTEGRPATFHDLRHTYATHLIANGANVRTVASMMGHADPTITMRTYATALSKVSGTAYERAAPTLTAGSEWASPHGKL